MFLIRFSAKLPIWLLSTEQEVHQQSETIKRILVEDIIKNISKKVF